VLHDADYNPGVSKLQLIGEIQSTTWFRKACKERMVFTFETVFFFFFLKKSNSLWPMKIICNSSFSVNK